MRVRDLSSLGSLGRLGAFLLPLAIVILTGAASARAQTPSAQELNTWQRQMRQALPSQARTAPSQGQTAASQGGCFSATYPNTQWQQLTCVPPPLLPYPPARGPRAETVGNGNDVTAQVTSGTIGETIGSFDSVVGVVSETGQVGGTGAQVANTFSLQINSNFFHGTPACSGAAEPSECEGWQQVVYSNAGSLVMQYWLINYYAECPSGWTSDGGSNCYENGFNAASGLPPQDITNLVNMNLMGAAVSGDMDIASVALGTTIYSVVNPDSTLDLAKYWNVSEFNIVGDCCLSQANFNATSDIVVRTEVANGLVRPPLCVAGGFTAETNNLSFRGAPFAAQGLYPALVFRQATRGSAAPCDAATKVSSARISGSHDFNADGHSDILFRNSNGAVAAWLMVGDKIAASGNVATVPASYSIIGQRDFDGDYDTDLLWRDTGGNLYIWFMNVLSMASTTALGNVPTNWTVMGTGDMNGDGTGDLLWQDTAGDLAIWFMNGATVSSSTPLGTVAPASGWNIVWATTGEILWRNSSGALALWQVNGSTVTSNSLGSVPSNWVVQGMGDYDGDGILDILWRDTSAGTVAIWFLNSSGVQSSASVATVPISANWSIVQTGDYNYDGMSDIIWKDGTGNVAIWLMNGATVSKSAGFGNVGTTWTVQSLNAE